MCRCERPGETVCHWVDPDGEAHELVVSTANGEDVPVFKLVAKPGTTIRFGKPNFTMEIEQSSTDHEAQVSKRQVRIDKNERGHFECWEPDGMGPGKHALFATMPTMELAVARVRKDHPDAKEEYTHDNAALFFLP